MCFPAKELCNFQVKKLETQEIRAIVLGSFLQHQTDDSFYSNLPGLPCNLDSSTVHCFVYKSLSHCCLENESNFQEIMYNITKILDKMIQKRRLPGLNIALRLNASTRLHS